MFPSKLNMVMDYKSEINRLFSAPENVDVLTNQPYGIQHSPFHYVETTQSSSSADSMSPESFADITTFRTNFSPVTPQNLPQTPQNLSRHDMATLNINRPVQYDTPEYYAGRRLRPIVGRQIFSSPDVNLQSTPKERTPLHFSEPYDVHMSSPEEYFQRTPPNPTYVERNCNRNLYELFPIENRDFKYRTPVKTSSPTMSVSTGSPIKLSPQSMPKSPVNPMVYGQTVWPGHSRQNFDVGQQKICSLCRKNGETPVVYMSHTVKERVGDQLVVSCPILRAHVCSTCGATGDNAHTMTYCPVLRSSNNGQPLRSTTITLKSTRVKSNGRRRF